MQQIIPCERPQELVCSLHAVGLKCDWFIQQKRILKFSSDWLAAGCESCCPGNATERALRYRSAACNSAAFSTPVRLNIPCMAAAIWVGHERHVLLPASSPNRSLNHHAIMDMVGIGSFCSLPRMHQGPADHSQMRLRRDLVPLRIRRCASLTTACSQPPIRPQGKFDEQQGGRGLPGRRSAR